MDPFDDLLVSDDPAVVPPLSPSSPNSGTAVLIPTPTHTHGSVGSMRDARAESYISAISSTEDILDFLPEFETEPEPEPVLPPARPPCEPILTGVGPNSPCCCSRLKPQFGGPQQQVQSGPGRARS